MELHPPSDIPRRNASVTLSLTCCDDVNSFGRRYQLGRPPRTSAHEGVRWDLAGLRIDVEDESTWTVQLTTPATVATEEGVGALVSVITVFETTAIEGHS